MSTATTALRTYRVKELEQMTGIEAWRWYEMFAQGKGPAHFRVGKVFRVSAHALAAWMRAREEEERSTKGGQA